MNILQIKDRFKLEMGKFMYSFIIEFFLKILMTFFSVSNYHDYHTKSATKNNFFIPKMNTRCGKIACSRTGAKIWNNFLPNLKIFSEHSFSKQFKKQIITKY